MVDNSCARTRSARGRRQPLQRDVTNKHLLAVLSPKDGRSVDAVVYTSDRWEGVSLRLSTGGRARLVREACSRAGRTSDLLGTVGIESLRQRCAYAGEVDIHLKTAASVDKCFSLEFGWVKY